MSNLLKAYWWTKVDNFGDRLAPLLLSRFAYLKPQWNPVHEAQVVSIGSVLEHIPFGWNGCILGSGKLREGSKLKFDTNATKVLALRGPLTYKDFTGSIALGDPGLLASELVEQPEKEWDLGILPHWQDTTLVDKYLQLIPAKFSCKVISPYDDPLTVISQIGGCKRLVTSSLHGIIVADSFGGIPRKVEICDKMNADGGIFKFLDYSASINTAFEVGKMIEPSSNNVDDAKYEIYDAYRALKEAL